MGVGKGRVGGVRLPIDDHEWPGLRRRSGDVSREGLAITVARSGVAPRRASLDLSIFLLPLPVSEFVLTERGERVGRYRDPGAGHSTYKPSLLIPVIGRQGAIVRDRSDVSRGRWEVRPARRFDSLLVLWQLPKKPSLLHGMEHHSTLAVRPPVGSPRHDRKGGQSDQDERGSKAHPPSVRHPRRPFDGDRNAEQDQRDMDSHRPPLDPPDQGGSPATVFPTVTDLILTMAAALRNEWATVPISQHSEVP